MTQRERAERFWSKTDPLDRMRPGLLEAEFAEVEREAAERMKARCATEAETFGDHVPLDRRWIEWPLNMRKGIAEHLRALPLTEEET